jgi:NAD(P)-dependent dehydrogenase (short-subunit alcohol dehydrogenase family)
MKCNNIFLLIVAIKSVTAFVPTIRNSIRMLPLHRRMSNNNNEGESRRDVIKKLVGGAVATGIVANGVSVQGPSPFQPAVGSMNNKVVVITGGNTGLGLESGKRLASAGATVVLTSRNAMKGARAVQSVKDYVKQVTGKTSDDDVNVYTIPLDLCDLKSIQEFPTLLKESDAVKKGGSPYIDVLMNNAGVMAIPELQLTKDGFEKTFMSNHLGHFALTSLLTPMLNPKGSRVINVSSSAYLIASKGLEMDNLNAEKGYKPWDAYGRSKLENILFTKELQRRADEAGKKITAVALHPGAVRTDLPRYIIGEDKFVSMEDVKPTATDILKLLPAFYFTKNVQRGANSQIYLASVQGNDTDIAGKFFFNMKENTLLPAATDMEKAKELWKRSEDMTGIKFALE